ncbi:MAG TPA: YicC/YloC family endoribonuclease [Acidiferrobacter sp.]|nr:YicC/YloC family endoribonuclease [Acidiferrobacter sp.]
MTAFAREQVRCEQGEAICEIRSVNHRYLEISVRVPDGLGALEGVVRERLTTALSRGKVDCQISFRGARTGASLALDPLLVAELVRVSEAIRSEHPGLAPLGLADILRWPGVMLVPPAPVLEDVTLKAADQAIAALLAHRRREGDRLAAGLVERLDQIQVRTGLLKGLVAGETQALRERLRARIAALGVTLEPGRLEQEVVLQTQRSDVAEELDRLAVHGVEVREILATGEPMGRRLDFLMQELNREANTLASKSPSAEATSQAVAIKVLIEQMREQVQNIE